MPWIEGVLGGALGARLLRRFAALAVEAEAGAEREFLPEPSAALRGGLFYVRLIEGH